MGVAQLWKVLEHEGVTSSEGLECIYSHVAGKYVALDVSHWLVHATTQPDLQKNFSQRAASAKIVFERCLQLLRLGATPVLVFDSTIKPIDKAGTSGSSRNMQMIVQPAYQVAKALGVPVLSAPGEAEAMCGALCDLGFTKLVVTDDGDALMHGADLVLKNLRLNLAQPSACKCTFVYMHKIRSLLGLASGGQEALAAVASLCGCDYDQQGTSTVGAKKALGVVQHLLRTRGYTTSDDGFFNDFESHVTSPPDDNIVSLKQCTGCKHCRHGCGSRSQHTKHGCIECGTSEGCYARKLYDGCTCKFHTSAGKRLLASVQRVHSAAEACNAGHAYIRASRSAREELQGCVSKQGQLDAQRPDIAALTDAVQRYGLEWSYNTVESKVLPVLLQHDFCHPDSATSIFWPERIEKERRSGNCKPWQYIVQPSPSDAFENQKQKPDARSIRKEVLQTHWPHLVKEFHERKTKRQGRGSDLKGTVSIKETFLVTKPKDMHQKDRRAYDKAGQRGKAAYEEQEGTDEAGDSDCTDEGRRISVESVTKRNLEQSYDTRPADARQSTHDTNAEYSRSEVPTEPYLKERASNMSVHNAKQAQSTPNVKESVVIDLRTPPSNGFENEEPSDSKEDKCEHTCAHPLVEGSPKKRSSSSKASVKQTRAKRRSSTSSAQQSITEFL